MSSDISKQSFTTPSPNNSTGDSDSVSNLHELYEVTKTVRFNLLPVGDYRQKLSSEEFKNEMSDFINNYKKVVDQFEAVVFYQNEEGEKALNPNIKIKLKWLKDFTKQEFFDDSKKDKPQLVKTKFDKKKQKYVKANTNVTLRETGFLKEKFENWLNQNHSEIQAEDGKIQKYGIIVELDKLNKSPLKNQSRKADFAYWMYQINHRNNFIFIHTLFESISNKNGGKYDDEISQTLEILKKCEDQIKNIQNYLRPSQSFGLEIEKTSLNYYTVNKKPKDYPKEISVNPPNS